MTDIQTDTDPRILNLSYSSLLTLHNCPRKFQLYKLNAAPESEDDPDSTSNLTFAYGHLVGTGIQDVLEGVSESQCLWNAFIAWPCDLFAENPKQNKSFFSAWLAVRQFHSMRESGYLDGYKLVEYKGKPANELSFAISLPDGFVYRGFVDAVLQHEVTGEVIVLECKTTSLANIGPAVYKNSAQAIGYSIVLDAIFPELSSYSVVYLVYKSKSAEYTQFKFDKSYYQRALWIQELLLDIETIKMYESASIYPMRGESCFSFYRECEYYNTCTLSTSHLTTKLTDAQREKIKSELATYQVQVTLHDLVTAQIAKEAVAVSQTLNGDNIL
jgi:hypothetical protein